MSRRVILEERAWPEFGVGVYPEREDGNEYAGRVESVREAMSRSGLTHLIVFADREHFANMAWLTGFDPRFEEALLVLPLDRDPLLLVGNECEDYLRWSPLSCAGKLRHERYQPFSLLDQPRDASRQLPEILASEGIEGSARVGCVGIKYYGDHEHPDAKHAIDIPSYIVDTVRNATSYEAVSNAAAIFMHPGTGLRARCSATEIAYFEHNNAKAAESIRRMLFGLRDGMTDHAVARLAGFDGEPLGCHPTLATGDRPGLCGPTGRTVRRGEPMSANVCYRGANICRAGWIAGSAADLPPVAQDYVQAFAGPYFRVMAQWLEMLSIGLTGGALSKVVAEQLPFDEFGIYLNPGHLIHLDEWLSSPMYPGSKIPLHSGMAIQVDVIPSSPAYGSTRMEDGIVLADQSLREELRRRYPDVYERCQQRRAFMSDTLGITLADEVLPLSNIPGIVPPFFLGPEQYFSLEA